MALLVGMIEAWPALRETGWRKYHGFLYAFVDYAVLQRAFGKNRAGHCNVQTITKQCISRVIMLHAVLYMQRKSRRLAVIVTCRFGPPGPRSGPAFLPPSDHRLGGSGRPHYTDTPPPMSLLPRLSSSL